MFEEFDNLPRFEKIVKERDRRFKGERETRRFYSKSKSRRIDRKALREQKGKF